MKCLVRIDVDLKRNVINPRQKIKKKTVTNFIFNLIKELGFNISFIS